MSSVTVSAKRQAWFLAALPASARKVRVLGEPELAEAVSECGYSLAAGAEPADAVLAGISYESPGWRLDAAGEELTAIAIDAAARPERRPAWRRVAELAASPLRYRRARVRADRALARLRTAGPAECMMMSDRSRTVYGLGDGLWRRRMPPVAAIVRSTAEPSVLEATVAEAGRELGRRFSVRGMTVRETAKLVTQLVDEEGRGYVLRMAGGSSAGYVEQAIVALQALSSSDAPAELKQRVPELLVEGRVGGARYQLERLVEGRHPKRMGPELRRECAHFLVELFMFRRTSPQSADALAGLLNPHIDVLAELLGPAEEASLRALGQRFPERLEGTRLGWGHGDFWRENVFIKGQRQNLASVIDWDAASPLAFPLHDLWDMITISRQRGGPWGAGLRCTKILWPLLQHGDEPQTRAFCERVGAPATREVLLALSIAYWLTRTTRELAEAPRRRSNRGWIRASVSEPAAIAAQLCPAPV